MTIQVTDAMVSRFLGWKLPQHFYPDCHISFDRENASQSPHSWPTGTNLLTATQARAMLEHVLGVEASGAISSKTAKVDVIFGGEVLARGVSPADPGQGPIDLGEVTGCQQAPSMIGENAPDLRPTAPVEAATLGEAKAEQQTAHQLSSTSRTGTDTQRLRMTDHTIEAEIVAKGLTAPRVTKARIDELMARIVYTCDQRPNGSTTTLVHAFLDGDFYLATGVSACVSVANFDANIGRGIATANAESAAQDKLWELEGYALRERLASGCGL